MMMFHQYRTFNEEAPFEYSYCHNYNRSQEYYGNVFPYLISISTHSTLHVQRRKRFKFVPSTTNESNAEEITL